MHTAQCAKLIYLVLFYFSGVIGTICTTLYIVIGGMFFWVEQYKYFHLTWYYLVPAILVFVVYGLLTAGVLYMLWRDEYAGKNS